MSQNNKTNMPWAGQDLKRHTPSQKFVNHERQSFLHARSIKEWFCFPVNFAKFLRTPFLQNTSGRLLLLRWRCKLKIWLQSKQIYAPLPWPLRCLKQHHCNNSWEFKALQQMSSEYLLYTSAYHSWLLICETGNK